MLRSSRSADRFRLSVELSATGINVFARYVGTNPLMALSDKTPQLKVARSTYVWDVLFKVQMTVEEHAEIMCTVVGLNCCTADLKSRSFAGRCFVHNRMHLFSQFYFSLFDLNHARISLVRAPKTLASTSSSLA